MNNNDFTTSIEVNESAERVFDAITHPENWWSGDVTGSAIKLNDEFTYRYKDLHMSQQKVVELIPGKRVVWLVKDSLINYAEHKNEWTGTKICFDISEGSGNSQLRFTHVGLHSDIECFESCSNSWTSLIHLSLSNLIITGKGEKLVLA